MVTWKNYLKDSVHRAFVEAIEILNRGAGGATGARDDDCSGRGFFGSLCRGQKGNEVEETPCKQPEHGRLSMLLLEWLS